MQPCHGAPPHPSAAGSSHFWMQYSGTPGAAPCGHARPCHVQVPVQLMGSAYGWPFAGSSLHTAAPYGQFAQPWTPPMQCQGCSGRHHTAEPEKKRELNEAYCLVDKEGKLKPFSSVSQLSGRSYEGMISMICTRVVVLGHSVQSIFKRRRNESVWRKAGVQSQNSCDRLSLTMLGMQ